MKRSRQLIIESTVVATFLLAVIIGGMISNSSLPFSWFSIPNPNSVTTQYELSSLALYYNSTLTSLGDRGFTSVSQDLNSFHFIDIPNSVNTTTSSANSEISEMNVTIPDALNYLQNSSRQYELKLYSLAALDLSAGCTNVRNSLASYRDFANTTTPQLSNGGVPVALYSIGMNSVEEEILALALECRNLTSIISLVYPLNGNYTSPGSQNSNPIFNFTIWSKQSSIETGGSVVINGLLSSNNSGIASESVLFYFNGTFIGTSETNKSGEFSENLTIPFVYVPIGTIQAYAESNKTTNFSGTYSNSIYFNILFNGTKIVLG